MARDARAPRFARVATSWIFGFDAFISYARADARPYAGALWRALEAKGLTVAWDFADLQAGENLPRTLAWRVCRSRYLILLDTPKGRRSTWVRNEVAIAIRRRRHVIRIAFPALTNADETGADAWHSLAPFRRQLEHEIWLDDAADPSKEGPAPDTVGEIWKKHRTARVLLRARALAAVVLLSAATFAVSQRAHQRADRALQAWQNRDVSIEGAHAEIAALFSDWRFPIDDVFASDEHWQLRNLVSSMALKRIAIQPTTSPPRADECGADGRAAASFPEGELTDTCVASLAEPDQQVAASAGDFDVRQIRVWEKGRWATAAEDIARFDRLAVSPTRYATISGGRLRIYDRETISPPADSARRRLTPTVDDVAVVPHDVAFSRDGRLLAVLTQPAPERDAYALSVRDSATGVLLADAPVVLREAGSRGAPCAGDAGTPYLWVAADTLVVCAAGKYDLFELRGPGGMTRYRPSAAILAAYIFGAAPGPGGSLAYFTASNEVVFCSSDGACEAIRRAGESIEGLASPFDIRGLSVADAQHVVLQTSRGTVRCSRAEGWTCSLAAAAGAPAAASPSALDQIPLDSIDRTRAAGSTVTASASGAETSSAVIAIASVRGSRLYVRPPRWIPGLPRRWRPLDTSGTVLWVTFADRDRRVDTIERVETSRGHQVIRRTYPIDPALVAAGRAAPE